MQITFLGTGAATAVPLPFCSCPTCRAARVQGGKDLRTRSALLINDDLLIDCGADAGERVDAAVLSNDGPRI